MGNITWTKSWSASDNGTVLGGADIQNIQNDVTTVVNGGITNSNINASALIAESKISFDISTGHDHDGTDSKTISATDKHYRNGLTLYGDDDDNVAVYPGTVDIAGTVITKTTVSGDIAVATGGNWLHGSSAASQWVYVYIYDDSSAINYKLSDEVPNICDASDNTAEPVFRYRKYVSTYYRCIGAVFQDGDSDLCWGHSGSEGRYVAQFDNSNTCVMCGLGTGADQQLVTLWTPKYARTIIGDDAPADGDNIKMFEATLEMLDGTWDATLLNAMHSGATHDWEDEGTAGAMKTMTVQSATVPGHCDMHAHTDGHFFYFMATTDFV